MSRSHTSRRPALVAAILVCGLGAAGCGARTGLSVSERDAGPPPDAPADARADARPDAPVDGGTPVEYPAVSIAAGLYHTCSARVSGRVDCWGFNDMGQLGNGSIEPEDRPVRVREIADAVQVTAGRAHSCARSEDGTVRCWGHGTDGELGLPDAPLRRLEPTPVPGIEAAVQVAAGARHTCALDGEGTVRCWGEGFERVPTVVDDLGVAKQVRGGFTSTCAIDEDGGVTCLVEELDEDGFLRIVPRDIALPAPARTLSMGDFHVCAVTEDRRAFCWGDNRYGQLGGGSTCDCELPPVAVRELEGVTDIAAGHEHTCGVADGRVWCWGRNHRGQLGDGGDHGSSSVPLRVEGLERVDEVTVGWRHSCARLQDGELYCWGRDVEGQLGNASRDDMRGPTRVEPPPP